MYLDHPRYGNKPIVTNISMAVEAIERAHWHYSSLKYFPNTVILADIEKQNYAIYPRTLYVDIEVQCGACSRAFIFFAQEQQYWFEVLGFWVDSHCTHCFGCRKHARYILTLRKRYDMLANAANKTVSEKTEHKALAKTLYCLGIIKNINKVNG
ncbi:zinc-ribbon domain containing protein [Pseudoalteromonas sp. SG45-5]|uniref:zinc-ribbon domain containing protein n=1 Tax=unclassified Pseudoalteromonas TaxID=194690 RepID=UPI0015F9472A|nr:MULTISPECIES: zinc-ribbon domain containing protein [unclassified Pseudoalteromonas]MBB1384664.1 zinc-ribbon domain containing protein [Pseudoalteromonas sp. SG45-5]MBB1392655.1 zinc-ribbon domain containing protein [Pseudoalteromonas sp. SG44-4]MBB1447286.1 zinc-ribbon domain containing protein [Pseudoalteromonas sp. SG41-6]